MSRCMYPGCASKRGDRIPFCGHHAHIAPTADIIRLVDAINKTGDQDYRRVENKSLRAEQRAATVAIVDSMMLQSGANRRTNPYKAIR